MKKIMIVDDCSVLRKMISYPLVHAGYETMTSENGRIGLEKLSTQTVDLIITDYNMPEMTGIEMIRNLRKCAIHHSTPILLLTTECTPEKKLEGKQAGANGWMVKPFTDGNLLNAVRVLLKE